LSLYVWFEGMTYDQIMEDIADFQRKHGDYPNVILVHPDNIDPKENKYPVYCKGGKQIKLTSDKTHMLGLK